MKVLCLIPARFASTRFPGKALAPILGRPMIQWVYEEVAKLNSPNIECQAAVVTDDGQIQKAVEAFGGTVIRVDDEVSTGSERIYLAWHRNYAKQNWDYIVNVQGDEPLIQADILKSLLEFQKSRAFDLATVVKARDDQQGLENPNLVKAIWEKPTGRCHYFSRAPIPFHRQKMPLKWHLHIGIYSYTQKALGTFGKANQSDLEKRESLEQLRALGLGIKIGAVLTDVNLHGVDVAEDIPWVEGVLRGKKS